MPLCSPATGCTLEAKAFQRDLDAYKALNAQIVGGTSRSLIHRLISGDSVT